MNIELDIISYQHVYTFNIMNYTSMICGYGMFSFHRDVTHQTWSGGESTIELYLPLWKNMKVNWDDDIANIWKKKTCSKPPTRKKNIYMFNMFNTI